MGNTTNLITQQGISTQKLYLNNKYYSNQKYGDVLNLNNNTKYSISPNAVKLLPIISNDENFVKLYTETNMSINVGDYVYIMFDDNESYDEVGFLQKTGKTILDNYYEFSGCTSGTTGTDWIYLKQSQGYEVIKTNDTNNEITIKRYYDSTLNNVKLYNHYLCKIYINKMKFYGGWIDGVCFRTVDLNSQTDTYIDVDIKQCIILSGGTNSGITAYYINMKDKYDKQYVSVNSLISTPSKKTIFSTPYKYNNSNNQIKIPVTSYFTPNNKEYGYTYIFYTKFLNSIINNGYYTNCTFSGGTINNGYFVNCKLYNLIVLSGNFINCNINSNSSWYYGIWYGSGSTCFGPSTWYNGIWNEGIFDGKTWLNGVFNGGMFKNSIWENGTFNGGTSIFNPNNNSNFTNSTWSNGTFNNGIISNSNWIKGNFNGGTFTNSGSTWYSGTFNNGNFINSNWISGTFNNGKFSTSIWDYGTFNDGTFSKSIWKNGIFNGGTFNTGCYSGNTFLSSGITEKWENGIFNGGDFQNSFWKDGTFNDGNFTNSIWSGGTFTFGKFNNSYWLYGDWKNGIVNNSMFHRVNWTSGTFNSGIMGMKMLITNPIKYDSPQVFWSGGTFNSGIFGNSDNIYSSFNNNNPEKLLTSFPSKIYWYGGNFYGGKFFINRFYANPTLKTITSGGFYNGVFHEGYFYGVYLGGHWINGYFYDRIYNWTNQIIPISIGKNYTQQSNTYVEQ